VKMEYYVMNVYVDKFVDNVDKLATNQMIIVVDKKTIFAEVVPIW